MQRSKTGSQQQEKPKTERSDWDFQQVKKMFNILFCSPKWWSSTNIRTFSFNGRRGLMAHVLPQENLKLKAKQKVPISCPHRVTGSALTCSVCVVERQTLSERWSNLTVRSLRVPLPGTTSAYASVCQCSTGPSTPLSDIVAGITITTTTIPYYLN